MSTMRRSSNRDEMNNGRSKSERKENVNQNNILSKLLKELSVQRKILHSLMQQEEQQERMHHSEKNECSGENSEEHHVPDFRNHLSTSAGNTIKENYFTRHSHELEYVEENSNSKLRQNIWEDYKSEIKTHSQNESVEEELERQEGNKKKQNSISNSNYRKGYTSDAPKCNVNHRTDDFSNYNNNNYEVVNVNTADNTLCCEEISALTECSPSPIKPLQFEESEEKQEQEKEEEYEQYHHHHHHHNYHYHQLLLSPEPTDTEERTDNEECKYRSHVTINEGVCDIAEVNEQTAECITPRCPTINTDNKQRTDSTVQLESRTSETETDCITGKLKEENDKEEILSKTPTNNNIFERTSDNGKSNSIVEFSITTEVSDEEKNVVTANKIEYNDQTNTVVAQRCNEYSNAKSNENNGNHYSNLIDKASKTKSHSVSFIDMIEE